MLDLIRHPHASTSRYSVGVEWEPSSSGLFVRFLVRQNSNDWIVNRELEHPGIGNWSLWNTDVVEVFLQARAHDNDITAPYLEVELSPINQKLALMITRPRVSFYTPLDVDFKAKSELSDQLWVATLDIPAPHGARLFGQFFACLGPNSAREYFSSSPHPTGAPDFHRPEIFRIL